MTRLGWASAGVLGACSLAVLVGACAGGAANDEAEGASAEDISTTDPAYAEGQLHSKLTPEIVAAPR